MLPLPPLLLLLLLPQLGVRFGPSSCEAAVGNTFYFLGVYEAATRDLMAAAQKAISDINSGSPSILPAGSFINLTRMEIGSESLFQSVCKTGNGHVLQTDAILDFTARPSCVEDLARHLDAAVMRAAMELTTDWPNTHPSPRNYMRAVASLLLRDNATRDGVMVLYDDTFDAGSILPYEDYSWYPPVYLRKIPANPDALLAEAKSLRIADFVVAASVANAANVVARGFALGLTGGIYHWFVTTKDLADFTCPTCGTGGQLFYFRQRAANVTKASEIVAGVDASVGASVGKAREVDVLLAYESVMALTRAMRAQIDAKGGASMNASNRLNCFGDYNASTPARLNDYLNRLRALPSFPGVMGNVTFAGTLRNTDSTFAVTQLQFSAAGVASSAKVGTWTRAGGLAGEVSSVELTYLTRRTLNVRVIHDPPFVMKLANGSFTGYSVEMLQGVAKQMNIDYNLVEQPDGAYGVMLANGTWNGMMGALERGEADLAIGPITITAQREQVSDFTVPIYDYVSLQIVLKKSAASNDQTFFLKAFTWDVWVCIIVIVTVTGFLIFFVDKVSPFSFQNRYRNDQVRDGEAEGKVFTVKESLWYVLGAYTQAGESFDPRSMSCRTIIIGFWLFGYLMMSLYTANLAAQLTVDKLIQPPQGFDELTTQASIKYTVIKDTAAYEHFQRMTNAEKTLYNYWLTNGIGTEDTVNQVAALETWKYPVIERYTAVWGRMSRWGFAESTEDALKKIREDGMAVFLDSALVKYYSGKSCDLMTVGESFAPRPYGMALRQKSPLLKALNMAILTLNENRVTDSLKQTWWAADKITCPVTDSSSGLSLQTLGGAFIFFCIGVGIAIIVFICEKIVAKIYGVEWAKDETKQMKQNTLMMMIGPSTATLRASNSSIRPATGGLPRPVMGHHRASSRRRSSVGPSAAYRVSGGPSHAEDIEMGGKGGGGGSSDVAASNSKPATKSGNTDGSAGGHDEKGVDVPPPHE